MQLLAIDYERIVLDVSPNPAEWTHMMVDM